ncbi:Cys-tRNA(Pro) deacylase [Mesobacillus subterraneus]|uniref:Cys-tRNA(Pro) deacylase n=1 Tax=Mesobacillus subterraneus TaxID=285983 RepID=UPI00203E6388|nr:Cys-tRNA(Pro) deacylase [Mesobacillus subterraneus]MCM3664528.1 Cys-tRNA(Pro) deacylase [Mesobacillus subterraneus]MCM3683956.1 Cys-tRNA(Pro) deacylase [Mesobacillus subterraneus]
MAKVKTNAMRILDTQKVPYEILTYDANDGKIDGVAVAGKIGRNPAQVYKTLVAVGASKNLYVFVIPVEDELDMKKAAKEAGEKSVEMLPVKDIQKFTGYIRGGCSPIGMKKNYPTYLDASAEGMDRIIVSAGKIGFQVELEPDQLINAADGKYAELTK